MDNHKKAHSAMYCLFALFFVDPPGLPGIPQYGMSVQASRPGLHPRALLSKKPQDAVFC